MKIHVTGDSLMARHESANQPMVTIKLHEIDPTLEVHNSAVSGNTTRDLLARFEDVILDKDSEYLFVLIGTNDLSIDRNVYPDEFEQNLIRLIDIFETRYETKKIHFLLPPPVDETKQKKRTNQRIEQYGNIIKKVCAQKGCQSLDLNQAFQLAVSPTMTLEQLLIGVKDDGLHFGEAGYIVLAKTIHDALL